MNIIKKHLPDFCYKPVNINVDGIVIHYFSGRYTFPNDPFNPKKCYNLFVDLNRSVDQREHYKMEDYPNRMYASAHFMIDREGNIYELVPLPYKAWHAGKSSWNGRENCNMWMVGVELLATHDSGYTDEQYLALDSLTEKLRSEYNISWDNITGHENVAPGRKTDPGPNFDWNRYKQLGDF